MHKITLTVLSILLAFTGFSQTSRCSADEALAYLIERNPELAENFQEQERLKTAYNQSALQFNKTSGTFTIPVVVHVVYANAAQNISETQILSQLRVLNEDFDAENADSSQIPSAFKPFFGDADIDFCLARQDPDGFEHSGITRTQTSEPSFSFDDKMKSSSTGGKDPWPRNSYLNIWVCNLTQGILGYAYPPGASADVDGVVIGYRYFGSIVDNDGSFIIDNTYKLGRTATHEVGHWLNLPHIWGQGSSCGNDFSADTPDQNGPNYGCPSFPSPSTCNSVSNAPNGDMFMNFMDYVDDDCMHMFTDNQASRMQNAITLSRTSLLTSTGCDQGLPVGIEVIEDLTFNLYPNPAQDYLQVQLGSSSDLIGMALIIDISGRLVKSQEISSLKNSISSTQIDLNNLQPGSYFLVIDSNLGSLNKRFVIVH